jgi:hypothetical protein
MRSSATLAVLLATFSWSVIAADVVYVVLPPVLAATAQELKKSQYISACDVELTVDCKAKPKWQVWGPIGRESAIALLREIGDRDRGISAITSDGKIARFYWSTISGGHTEFWKLQDGEWIPLWGEEVPF